MEREWYDVFLLGIFTYFAFYKGVRMEAHNRVGYSMRAYNITVAFLFLFGIFILPHIEWPDPIEMGIMTAGRAGLVGTIMWCIVEIELARGTPKWKIVGILASAFLFVGLLMQVEL